MNARRLAIALIVATAVGCAHADNPAAPRPAKAAVDSGLDPRMVAAYIRSQLPKVKDCYDSSLKTNPMLVGRLVLHWTVDASGTPRDVRIESNTVPSSPIPSCLEALVREQWHFPKPTSGNVEVSFPFVFLSAKAALELPEAVRRAAAANDRVIFDRDTARKAWHFDDTDDFWTPATGDVQALEEQLPSFLKEETSRHVARMVAAGIPADSVQRPRWERPLSYHRQYVGIAVSGRRIIYGNFFCDDPPVDWRREAVRTVGGGGCCFHLRYDVEERRLFDLYVNAAR